MNVLVVFGPNLNLLGEDKKDPVGYQELQARLVAFAGELGATLRIVQSNHEGALLDAIQAGRTWAQAILIAPAALAPASYALRECLRIVGLPAIEVHLEDIRRRETWRRKSVLKEVCEAQVMGKGLGSFLDGLERLVTGQYAGVKKGKARTAAAAPTGAQAKPTATSTRTPALKRPAGSRKSIGPRLEIADPATLLKEAAMTAPPAPKQAIKTLGRLVSPSETPSVVKSIGLAARNARTTPAAGITRAAVRERIAERLGNRVSPGVLAAWARDQWLNIERGAPAEAGHRELLEETLQALALSSTAPGRLGDEELIELMTRLD